MSFHCISGTGKCGEGRYLVVAFSYNIQLGSNLCAPFKVLYLLLEVVVVLVLFGFLGSPFSFVVTAAVNLNLLFPGDEILFILLLFTIAAVVADPS